MTTLLLLFLSLVSFQLSAEVEGDNIPYPFYTVQENAGNRITLLNRGEEALAERLRLISEARKSVTVEYYIYNTDRAGKLMTQELIKAAQRGVEVRLLIDDFDGHVFFHSYFAHEVEKLGVQVKYYNNAPFLFFSTAQYRNHRKLITIDDTYAITGGRNIGEDYFNLSPHLNYDDRDIIIEGPMAKTMRESFDAYFNHKISSDPKKYKRPSKKKTLLAQEFMTLTPEDEELRKYIMDLGEKQKAFRQSHPCPTMTYVTDAPGANFTHSHLPGYMRKFRFVRKILQAKIDPIDRNLIISSPYFIPNKRNRKLMESLLEKGVEVSFHTNSLASTDAVMMSANLYLRAKGWIKKGMKLFLHDGENTEVIPSLMGNVEPKIWGTHAKTHVYETSEYSEIMVGTYNFDNRSDYYNSEMAIFCKGNDALTEDLKSDLKHKMDNGITVDENGKGRDRRGNPIHISGASKEDVAQMMILMFPSKLIDFLL